MKFIAITTLMAFAFAAGWVMRSKHHEEDNNDNTGDFV